MYKDGKTSRKDSTKIWAYLFLNVQDTHRILNFVYFLKLGAHESPRIIIFEGAKNAQKGLS